MSEYYLGKKAFRLASEFISRIYGATACFPKEESFGLTLRLRRAAIDVAAGLSCGVSDGTLGVSLSSVQISQSRLDDVRTYIGTSKELGYLSEEAVQPILTDCARIGMCLRSLLDCIAG